MVVNLLDRQRTRSKAVVRVELAGASVPVFKMRANRLPKGLDIRVVLCGQRWVDLHADGVELCREVIGKVGIPVGSVGDSAVADLADVGDEAFVFSSRLFSQAELKSIKLLRFKPVNEPYGEPTSKQPVQWVAEIGGHTGPQNGLPGSETISRCMLRIETGVTVLEYIGWAHDPRENDQ